MVTVRLGIEDAIVYLVLLMWIMLFSSRVPGGGASQGNARIAKVARQWRVYAIVLLTYVLTIGILHQVGYLRGVLSHVMTGVALAGLIGGWIRFKGHFAWDGRRERDV